MDHLTTIRGLDGAMIVRHNENAWGPSGKLGVANLQLSGADLIFDLLVPTSPTDIWDYIWRSEKEEGSTQKVQLFQAGTQVTGSRVTAISREGQDKRWDATGPEQYRLTFVVPVAAVTAGTPVEVRFFWAEKHMSTAVGSGGPAEAT